MGGIYKGIRYNRSVITYPLVLDILIQSIHEVGTWCYSYRIEATLLFLKGLGGLISTTLLVVHLGEGRHSINRDDNGILRLYLMNETYDGITDGIEELSLQLGIGKELDYILTSRVTTVPIRVYL
jgi:hypothetical protein